MYIIESRDKTKNFREPEKKCVTTALLSAPCVMKSDAALFFTTTRIRKDNSSVCGVTPSHGVT